jgi:hypothetical protein
MVLKSIDILSNLGIHIIGVTENTQSSLIASPPNPLSIYDGEGEKKRKFAVTPFLHEWREGWGERRSMKSAKLV